jgi:tetratricopeptide (TPR) repeat protein
MSEQAGAWLRREREARGWDRPEMARQLIAAARSKGDSRMPGVKSLTHNIYRWENGDGVSQRYMLAYCAAFGIGPAEFPRRAPDTCCGGAQRDASNPGQVTAEEVLTAAHDASERAWQAEQRGIGDSTLEQLHADVTRLSRDYMTASPLPLFREMLRVRDRMHDVLDQRIWPRDTAETYVMLGCVDGLMGCVAADLGCTAAAAELARAGWAFAVVAGHRPLMAKLRLDMAGLSYRGGQARRAADLAASGLDCLAAGPTAVQLHLLQGRAAARLGDISGARKSIEDARRALDLDYSDDLTAAGGEFDLSRASAQYLTGSVLAEIPGAPAAAAAQFERAVELYAAGPGPGETHGYGTAALANISLASARLATGALDAAAAALETVLALPPGRRIDPIPQGLARLRAELAAPAYHSSAPARNLGERIAAFNRESIAASAP